MGSACIPSQECADIVQVTNSKAPCGCCPRAPSVEDWNTSCYTNGAWWKEIFHLLYRASPRSRGYPISISLYSLADRLNEFGVSS